MSKGNKEDAKTAIKSMKRLRRTIRDRLKREETNTNAANALPLPNKRRGEKDPPPVAAISGLSNSDNKTAIAPNNYIRSLRGTSSSAPPRLSVVEVAVTSRTTRSTASPSTSKQKKEEEVFKKTPEEDVNLWCRHCKDRKEVEICKHCGCMVRKLNTTLLCITLPLFVSRLQKCHGKMDSDILVLCDRCDRLYNTLHSTSLYYNTLHSTLLHCNTLHSTLLYYNTLHSTLLHYNTLHSTLLHYNTIKYTTVHYILLRYIIMHLTMLYYDTLHSTSLYYNALHSTLLYYNALNYALL